MDKLIVSSSPHIKKKNNSTSRVMSNVLIGLFPAMVMSVVFYGVKALIVLLACMISCVVMEFIYCKLMKKENTIKDLSALVTGTLLGFCLTPTLPVWMAVIGSFVSIIVVKQLFGGLGRNFANPALVGRLALMLSFSVPMSDYIEALDGVSSATPLAWGKADYMDLFFGKIGGSMGEVCKVALLIGGIYLIVRKVITITIPVSFIGSVAIFSLLFGVDPIFHILAGGAILGAFFMATDYVTSPSTEMGKLIFGIGCGFITMLIRVYGNYPEGVSFAVLLMNILTPYIDNVTRIKPIGGEVA